MKDIQRRSSSRHRKYGEYFVRFMTNDQIDSVIIKRPCGASLGMRSTFSGPINTVDLVIAISLHTYSSLAFSNAMDFTYGTETGK